MNLAKLLEQLPGRRELPLREPAAAPAESERHARHPRTDNPGETPATEQDRFEHGEPVPAPAYGETRPAVAGERSPASGLSLMMGRISLDLTYARASGTQTENGFSGSFHAERLHLDFSFLQARIGEGGEEMTQRYREFLDSGAVDEFMNAVGGLDFSADASLDRFNSAVDNLFNRLEEALGMESDELDYAQDTFKSFTGEFFDRVQADMARLEAGDAAEALPETGAPVDPAALKPNLFEQMGRLFERLGDHDTAGSFFEKALGAIPEDRDYLKEFITRLLERLDALRSARPGALSDLPQDPAAEVV